MSQAGCHRPLLLWHLFTLRVHHEASSGYAEYFMAGPNHRNMGIRVILNIQACVFVNVGSFLRTSRLLADGGSALNASCMAIHGTWTVLEVQTKEKRTTSTKHSTSIVQPLWSLL